MRKVTICSWVLAVACLVGIAGSVQAGLTEGLISYWGFDEAEGTVAQDSTGASNGEILGGAARVTGKFGSALSLDGAGFGDPGNADTDYVDCGSDDSLKPNRVTVAAWVKQDAINYYGQIAGFAFDEGSNESGYSILSENWGGNGYQMWLRDLGGGYSPINENHTLSQWNLIVGTYDGDEAIVYVNGIAGAPLAAGGGDINYDNVTTFKIGVYSAGGWWLPYTGLIDEVAVWDRALSSDEIAYLYNGGAGREIAIKDATPANGADLVDPGAILAWTPPAGYSQTAYNVYLGTDPNTESNPLVSAAQTELSYDPALDFETTYYWRIDLLEPNNVGTGFTAVPGAWLMFTTAPALPVIVKDPGHLNLDAGGTGMLAVGDLNGENYQWFKEDKGEGVPLSEGAKFSGVTTPVLTIADFQEEDEGMYYCQVSNGAGSVLTASAAVRVKRMTHHWPLDGNADDIIGGINGTIVGDPNFVAGKDGQAISLLPNKGELDSVVLGLVGDIVGDLDFTISIWVNTTGTPTWGSMLSSKDWDSGGNTGIGLFDYNGTVHWNIADEHRWRNDLASPTFYDGQWHNVCVTVDREGQQTMYLDGEVTDSADIQGMIGTIEGGSPLAIGIDAIGNYPFQGKIDDLRMWNYPLGPVEAALIYTDMNPGENVCIEPLGIWDLNNDCIINLGDIAEIAARWLNCNRVPECITE